MSTISLSQDGLFHATILGNSCHLLVGFDDRTLDGTMIGKKACDAWAAGRGMVDEAKRKASK